MGTPDAFCMDQAAIITVLDDLELMTHRLVDLLTKDQDLKRQAHAGIIRRYNTIRIRWGLPVKMGGP